MIVKKFTSIEWIEECLKVTEDSLNILKKQKKEYDEHFRVKINNLILEKKQFQKVLSELK